MPASSASSCSSSSATGSGEEEERQQHRHRFVAVLEGLRQQQVKQQSFIDVCGLPEVMAMGCDFVRAKALHVWVHAELGMEKVATEEDLVRLFVSAFGFALFQTDEQQQAIHGAAAEAVRASALRLVEYLERFDHHQKRPHMEHKALTRKELCERLREFDRLRQVWHDGDAPHAVCRLEDAIKLRRAEAMVPSTEDKEAIHAMGLSMRSLFVRMRERKGDARVLYEVRLARSQRRVVRTKRELARIKKSLYGMWATWGSEMWGEMQAYEQQAEELRLFLRRLTNRHVVESEDSPQRYLVRVTSLTVEQTAFADQFLLDSTAEREGNDDEGGLMMIAQPQEDATNTLLFSENVEACIALS